MDRKTVNTQIRELLQEMREQGIKKVSCFNGGLTPTERRYNTRLFELRNTLSKLPK